MFKVRIASGLPTTDIFVSSDFAEIVKERKLSGALFLALEVGVFQAVVSRKIVNQVEGVIG